MKDKTQNQKSGNDSVNYQAETINQCGLSYKDVKDIALDIFKNNFLVFSDEAKQITINRAEELTNGFLNDIRKKNPNLLNAVQEPSMQYALYSAQKSYAISGDKNTANILVDILIERAGQDERNLAQIVLDESLEIVPKLTINQLDILSTIYLIKYPIKKINNLEKLNCFLKNDIKPFTEINAERESDYIHLVYCNCGSLLDSDGVLTFKRKYRIEEFLWENYKDIFYDELKIEKDKSENSKSEVKNFLVEQSELMKKLYEIWSNSEMPSMKLTSVGITLAQANLKKRTEMPFDLSVFG